MLSDRLNGMVPAALTPSRDQRKMDSKTVEEKFSVGVCCWMKIRKWEGGRFVLHKLMID